MIITKEQLAACCPTNKAQDKLLASLNKTLPLYNILTTEQAACFLAQCGHESSDFNRLVENLNYSTDGLLSTFKKYFNSESAAAYAHMPEKIANHVYADRMGNGPESSGDGFKFRGRGAIQLTGKDSYTKFATALTLSLDETVAYASTLEGAIESACWYWNTNHLNAFADKLDILGLTKRINGGVIGLEERKSKLDVCIKELK